MSPEFWAIIGVGACIFWAISKLSDQLAETNRRLQNFWEEFINRR